MARSQNRSKAVRKIQRMVLRKLGVPGLVVAVLVGLGFSFFDEGGDAAWAPSVSYASAEVGDGFPKHFDQAKDMVRDVHKNNRVEIYCGCEFDARSAIGSDCPIQTTSYENRAGRIEWEHVVPASDFGRARPCWKEGGRGHCEDQDPQFRMMHADPHNLWPAVGSLNAVRSNHRFGMVPRASTNQFGPCGFKIEERVVEPPDAAKGKVARSYLYMRDTYGHPIGSTQLRIFEAWDRQFPPTNWELQRNRKIASIAGVENRFISRYEQGG